MKRIVLLSDTHGYIDDTILKHARWADEVWHAGDIGTLEVTDAIGKICPVKAVYGNIDGASIRKEFSLNERFQCEGIDVFMTHIGGYPGRYEKRVRKLLDEQPPDLYICGHSHILKVVRDKKRNLLHMNPGAIGKQGFHKVRTLLRFEIDGTDIKNLEVVEFKR